MLRLKQQMKQQMKKLSYLFLTISLLITVSAAFCGGPCCQMQVVERNSCHETADENSPQNDCCGGCSFKIPFVTDSRHQNINVSQVDFLIAASGNAGDVFKVVALVSDAINTAYFPSPPRPFSSRAPPLL